METRRQREQFLLYLAYFISQIGNWSFRIGIIIGLLQSSASAMGLGVAVIFAPIIVGSLIISPLTDRMDRLAFMIGVDILRALAMIPLFIAGRADTVVTFVIIALLSLSQPAFMSAQVGYLRSVTAREDMVSAVRNISNVDWITYVIGMTTGAILSAHLDLTGILVLNAATFIISALLLAVLKGGSGSRTLHQSPLPSLKPGSTGQSCYGYLFSIFMLNLGAGIINVYPAIRSSVEQSVNQTTLATIVIVNGIFGFLGALLVKPIYQRLGAFNAMALSAGSVSLFLLLMAINGSVGLAVVSSSLMLCMGQIFAVSAQTHLISGVTEDRAGKLSGLFQCCTFGGIALNGMLFALMSGHLEFIGIVKLCALCAFIAFAVNIVMSARRS